MNYIVLDLEWNQCPSGKNREDPLLPFEIIEIGAVKLDDRFEIVDSYREIIRPLVYRRLHHRTREVVHLREKDFAGKRTFPEAAGDFSAWCGEDPLFCTWGPSDLTELQRNYQRYDIPSPFPYPFFYYDLQKIFSIRFEDRKTRRSLESAVEFLQISENEPFHDAYTDASYAARIMQHLTPEDVLNNSSIDYFRTPASRKEEIRVRYRTYEKFVSRPFKDRHAAIRDRVVASTVCYECKKPARKKIRWFSAGSKNYFCLAYCEEHGWLKGKARMRLNRRGETYVVKTLRLITEEEAIGIRDKKELVRVKRKLKHTAL